MKEQIEIIDLKKTLCGKPCDVCGRYGKKCIPEYNAERLYNAGWRKQSAVIDEFANRLKEKMNDLSRMEYNCVPYFLVSKSFIDKIAAEMKGGAE